jgi:hypothetical protein
MNFEDSKLKQHYERVASLMTTLPRNMRPICALLDAWQWFKLTEGKDSPRVHETVRLLARPELRSSLKTWYLRQTTTNVAIDEYRHALEQIIEEKLPLGTKGHEV